MKSFEQKKVIDTQGGHVYSLVISSDYIIAGTYENCIHVSVFIQCVNVISLIFLHKTPIRDLFTIFKKVPGT